MNVEPNDWFRWLKAADIDGEFIACIEDVLPARIPNDPAVKRSLVLKNHHSRLVLNVTNATVLANAYGKDTDLWIGKRVRISVGSSFFNGKSVPGIKVHPVHVDGHASPLAGPSKRPGAEAAHTEDSGSRSLSAHEASSNDLAQIPVELLD